MTYGDTRAVSQPAACTTAPCAFGVGPRNPPPPSLPINPYARVSITCTWAMRDHGRVPAPPESAGLAADEHDVQSVVVDWQAAAGASRQRPTPASRCAGHHHRCRRVGIQVREGVAEEDVVQVKVEHVVACGACAWSRLRLGKVVGKRLRMARRGQLWGQSPSSRSVATTAASVLYTVHPPSSLHPPAPSTQRLGCTTRPRAHPPSETRSTSALIRDSPSEYACALVLLSAKMSSTPAFRK